MSDVLQDGMDWLQTQREAYMSRAVVYSRSGNTVSVNATVGPGTRAFRELAAAFGVTFEWRDFLIKGTLLIFDGAVDVPRVGDKILDTVDGIVKVYEVAGIADQPCYMLSDADTLRIHAKLTDGDDDA